MTDKKIANKRLANKVIWNLEDIQAIVKDLWEIDVSIYGPWCEAVERAEKQQDAIMLKHLALLSERLAHLSRGLARIERKARDAREGEYCEDE